nr:InlB B-repeat-containing protein [Eubacterium sp.]
MESSSSSRGGSGCGIGGCDSGRITISGGNVTATGGDATGDIIGFKGHGIYGGTIEISGTANVEATGGNGIVHTDSKGMYGGHGIFTTSEDGLKITGGSPTVKAIGGDGAGVKNPNADPLENQPGGHGIRGNVTVSSGVTDAEILATAGVDKDGQSCSAIGGTVVPGPLKAQEKDNDSDAWSLANEEYLSDGIIKRYAKICKYNAPSTGGGGSSPRVGTCTITFDANGGTGSMVDHIVPWTKDNSVNVKLDKNQFTRDGYTFVGWNTKADNSGNSYKDEQEITINGNMKLYAQWKGPWI